MPRLTLVLSLVSLAGMIAIDRALGPRAEFLNGWSVVERLLGRAPSARPSLVAARLGSWGELAVVLLGNVAIGALFAWLIRLVVRAVR